MIIFSKTEEDHIRHLNIVFDTIEKANMKVPLDKCEFLKQEIEFLGFVVSVNGIKTNAKNLKLS